MKVQKISNKTIKIIGLIVLAILFMRIPITVFAKSDTPKAKVYEFDKKSKYEINGTTPSKNTNTLGQLSITGDFSVTEEGDSPKLDVKKDTLDITYSINTAILGNSSDKWHLYEDTTKIVNGIELDEKILNGAIIVQSSLDGKKYVTDTVMTNAFTSEYDGNSPIYQTKDIQLVNGCYYRIIVAYEQEIIKGQSKVLFVTTDDEEYRKIAEVYDFYAVNSSEKALSDASSTPRKELGEKIAVKKDSGYSQKIDLDNKNPHYGWNLGTFSVNGYTREMTKDGKELFLKNAGDKVTLWFKLEKDIDDLKGDGKYQIVEDKDGSDMKFEVAKTNFKRGALIIRFTDHEGKRHDPIVYTNFLAADATTGADTKAVLFEEGDYEVALDYTIGETGILGSDYDYRISFEFSIRNGNTMFFPFDLATGAELRDNAITPNGFTIDMAKSRYLNINVERTAIVEDLNGHSEDVRFNGPAKDGNEYKEEGVYTVDVTNQYTDEHTTKKFFVGSDPFLIAMAKSGKTAKEIDDFLSQGYTLEADGSLVAPVVEEEEETKEDSEQEDKEETVSNNSGDNDLVKVDQNKESTVEDTKPSSVEENEVQTSADESSSFPWGIIVFVVIAVVTVCVVVIAKKKK